ncbi:MAG: ABC transporter permease subunit [Gemmataceae bacterium]
MWCCWCRRSRRPRFVRERVRGTLALLLTSPLSRWSIYVGKLASVLGLTLVLLTMTLPAAAACHALGGSGSDGGIVTLYAVLVLAAIQLSTLALFVSSRCQSADGALRVTYGLVLAVVVLAPVPYMLVRGGSGPVTEGADWLRCLSPGPAVMELLGQGDVGAFGMVTRHPVATRYVVLAGLSALVLALLTVARLDQRMLDRGRPAGVMTEDRSAGGRFLRRLVFLVDPQRRSGGMSGWVNPVLGKELRSRRFGRSHWVLRLIAGCAILSLRLSATSPRRARWGGGSRRSAGRWCCCRWRC